MVYLPADSLQCEHVYDRLQFCVCSTSDYYYYYIGPGNVGPSAINVVLLVVVLGVVVIRFSMY